MLGRLSESIVVPSRLTLLMWGIFFFEVSWNYDLGFLGILPRDAFGMVGIVFAPLLHGSYPHIMSNTVPLLFLGTSIYFFYPRIADKVMFYSYFLTGTLVWLLGNLFSRPSLHIGASGLIYGLAFFLIFFGFFRKDFKSLLISIVVIVLYGSLFYGLVPLESGISYESHFFGALTGVGLAINYGRRSGSFSRTRY